MMKEYYEAGMPQLTPTSGNDGSIQFARKVNDPTFSWRCVLCNETIDAGRHHADCLRTFWDEAVEYAKRHWCVYDAQTGQQLSP
jgi:hypothetical protein